MARWSSFCGGQVTKKVGSSSDPLVLSHTGRTLDGHPLAFNHAPSAGLKPWFCWFSVTHAEVPQGHRVHDFIFNDLATIRILFGGRWEIETADGFKVFEAGDRGLALFFGAHSRRMPVSIEGRFKVLSVQLAPGASAVMGGPGMSATMDRVLDHDELAGHGRLASRFDPDGAPGEWLEAFEVELGKFVSRNNTRRPDALTMAFERCVLAHPETTICGFAREHGVTTRTVERAIGRDYGISPKQVLRRARALDLAAALLGVARESEDGELRLRYFDQSHMIREIRHFFGVTPMGLREGTHPLLRLTAETRQARRLEALQRPRDAGLQPWRDPTAEPAD